MRDKIKWKKDSINLVMAECKEKAINICKYSPDYRSLGPTSL